MMENHVSDFFRWVDSTLRLPNLNYGWFSNIMRNGGRYKRYNTKYRPTPSSLSAATFEASPQIFGSPYDPQVQHNPVYENSYKRSPTTTPGFQPKRRPQYPYSALTPPPESVVTDPKTLSQLPNQVNAFPTTLQLLTDFNAVKIPASSITIRSPNTFENHGVYPTEEQNEVAYSEYLEKQPDFLESTKKTKSSKNQYQHDYHSQYIPLKNEHFRFPKHTKHSRFPKTTKAPKVELSTKAFSYPKSMIGHMPSFGDFLKSEFTTHPKKRNVQQHQYSYESPDTSSNLPSETPPFHPQEDTNPYYFGVNSPSTTEKAPSYSHSQSIIHSQGGNYPPATSFIHNSFYDTPKKRRKQDNSHKTQFAHSIQDTANNELPYLPGYESDELAQFASFGQTLRKKRKTYRLKHPTKHESPAYSQSSFGEQLSEQHPSPFEQQSYSDPVNYQHSHFDQPEKGFVAEHANASPDNKDEDSFHEVTSPSPYADKFAHKEQPLTTISPYSNEFAYNQRPSTTTESPYAEKFGFEIPKTTSSPYADQFVSNEKVHSWVKSSSHTRPPRQSPSYYEKYKTTTKSSVDENIYYGLQTTTTGYNDHFQSPDHTLNEISNYPTAVVPKIKFEKHIPPYSRRNKKQINHEAGSSSYSASSSPHATYQTIVDHNSKGKEVTFKYQK